MLASVGVSVDSFFRRTEHGERRVQQKQVIPRLILSSTEDLIALVHRNKYMMPRTCIEPSKILNINICKKKYL